MSDAYIEQRDGVHMVAGTRVSLDSIVYAFLDGQSAEAIAQAFPVLTLEQVYGAIAYYLAHRDEVDRYLRACFSFLVVFLPIRAAHSTIGQWCSGGMMRIPTTV